MKKSSLLILSLLLFCLLAITVCLNIFLDSSNSSFAFASEAGNARVAESEYYRNSAKSVELYGTAMAPFSSQKSGGGGEEIISYSDDFGGVYIDGNGYLNIGKDLKEVIAKW